MGKLESECRKDRLEVASIGEVSRAEEARPESPIREGHLSHGLSDGRFPRPGESIQPEDMLLLFSSRPAFDLPQNILPSSPQAPPPVPAPIPGIWRVIHPVQQGEVR